MAGKKIIKLDLQYKKLVRSIDKLVKLTDANTQVILKEATATFTDFAARQTEPSKGKKNIPANRYKRKAIKLTFGKSKNLYVVYISRRGQKKILRYGSSVQKLKKYLPITYRGISRAGWYINQAQAIGKALTSAEQYVLDKSPEISKLSNRINSIRVKRDSVSVTNSTPDIQRYARIALAQGIREAARVIDKERRKFLKEQASNPL